MKIIGKTLQGDLIISISQAEWDGLRDGIRPKEDWTVKAELWTKTEAAKFLGSPRRYANNVERAFRFNQIDGSLQSLRDLAAGKPKLAYVSKAIRVRLKTLLDSHTTQTEEKS